MMNDIMGLEDYKSQCKYRSECYTPDGCDICYIEYLKDLSHEDIEFKTAKEIHNNNICPECGRPIEYFQTQKKWYCSEHGFVDHIEDLTYKKVVNSLRKQFGLKGDSD